MIKKFAVLLSVIVLFSLSSCKEHFSDGERVGTITKFSKAGVIWDSWDGLLNITQTGMNSSGEPFEFSLDNDRTDQDSLRLQLIEAQRYGWKVKIIYHQVWGLKNIWCNRGESDYFVDDVQILDKGFANPFGRNVVVDSVAGKTNQAAPLGSKENPIHIVIDNK